MDRRSLLKSLAGIGVAAVVPPIAAPKRYGMLDVQGHTAHQSVTGEFLRVTVNGRDVTDRCCEADDVRGYVVVFCRDRVSHQWDVANGALHLGGEGSVCTHRIEGDVIIAPGIKS